MAISICTTVGHIKPNPECYLQRGSRLQNLEDKALAEFSLYRGAYISEKLMEVKDEQLYSNNGFLINDYVDIYILSRMVNVMCAINVLDLFQRAMLNVLIAELTWRDTKMITIHIFGQNQNILLRNLLWMLENLAWSILPPMKHY